MTIMGGAAMAFIRTVKVKTSSGETEEYVRIVESYREGGKQKQRVIAHLGNVKSLKLQDLLLNLSKYRVLIQKNVRISFCF